MTKNVRACTAQNRNHELLQGQLSRKDQEVWEQHLSDCTECQEHLQHSAGGREYWDEARCHLGLDPYRSSLGLQDGNDVSDSRTIQYVLEALAPTDDPDMLGRLGGYEVSGVVGVGGMGVVLKAFDRSLDRIVAIKVLAPHLATSGSARRRFAREAKAAAAVLHPNIVAIHGVSNDEPLPYLVMPYIRGESLQKRIARLGPLPTIETLRIALQIASGLAAAHDQGLVHRDIKPANILLEEGVERVTVTDFGLARAVDDASMTRSGVIAGTPQYMSPEQARGEPIDSRSDLFSLGSVLYAMCTGRSPFRAESSYGAIHRIVNEEATPIEDINHEIPDWLCRLIRTLHRKGVDERIATAESVVGLVTQCIAHVEQQTPIPELLRPERPSRVAKAVLVVVVPGLLGILVGTGVWWGGTLTNTGETVETRESDLANATPSSSESETRQANERHEISDDITCWDGESLLSPETIESIAIELHSESLKPFDNECTRDSSFKKKD